jgi:hypothetical protein
MTVQDVMMQVENCGYTLDPQSLENFYNIICQHRAKIHSCDIVAREELEVITVTLETGPRRYPISFQINLAS